METPPSFLFSVLGLGRAEEPRDPIVWQGAVSQRWKGCDEDLGNTQTSAAPEAPAVPAVAQACDKDSGWPSCAMPHPAHAVPPGASTASLIPSSVGRLQSSMGRWCDALSGAGTLKEASCWPRFYRKIWEFSTRENTASFQGLGVKYRRRQWLLLYLETGGERECLPSSFLSL